MNGPQVWDLNDLYGEGTADLDTLALAHRDAGGKWYYEDLVAFFGTKGRETFYNERDYGNFYGITWFTPDESEYLTITFQMTDEGYLKWNVGSASDGVYARYKELK